MNEKKIRLLIEKASEIYNSASGRFPGVERWCGTFSADSEDRIYADKLYSYLLTYAQNPSKLLFMIHEPEKREILEHLTDCPIQQS